MTLAELDTLVRQHFGVEVSTSNGKVDHTPLLQVAAATQAQSRVGQMSRTDARELLAAY